MKKLTAFPIQTNKKCVKENCFFEKYFSGEVVVSYQSVLCKRVFRIYQNFKVYIKLKISPSVFHVDQPYFIKVIKLSYLYSLISYIFT